MIERSEGIIHVERSTEKENALKGLTIEEKKEDLQVNYTDHLRALEKANMDMVKSVVKNAQYGFSVSLILNVSSFILGITIICVGIYIFIRSPESLGQTIGILSSVVGLGLVISLLFWRGPLERILGSAANLAQINAISLGLAHRLNQISRVFVQFSLDNQLTVDVLKQLNQMVESSVKDSVSQLDHLLPEETAEAIAERITSQQLK